LFFLLAKELIFPFFLLDPGLFFLILVINRVFPISFLDLLLEDAPVPDQLGLKLHPLVLELCLELILVPPPQVLDPVILLRRLLLPSEALLVELSLKALVLLVQFCLELRALLFERLLFLLEEPLSQLLLAEGILFGQLLTETTHFP
jgi:hypothetical protein